MTLSYRTKLYRNQRHRVTNIRSLSAKSVVPIDNRYVSYSTNQQYRPHEVSVIVHSDKREDIRDDVIVKPRDHPLIIQGENDVSYNQTEQTNVEDNNRESEQKKRDAAVRYGGEQPERSRKQSSSCYAAENVSDIRIVIGRKGLDNERCDYQHYEPESRQEYHRRHLYFFR